jgi:hypothetical protein
MTPIQSQAAVGSLLREWRGRRRLTQLELAFFGMFASFDTPFEVTTSELAIEFLLPADRATAEQLRDTGSGSSRR